MREGGVDHEGDDGAATTARTVDRSRQRLLRLVPQLSLPILVVQLVDLVTDTVRQARSALLHLQQQTDQMVLVVARAAELNDPGLIASASARKRTSPRRPPTSARASPWLTVRYREAGQPAVVIDAMVTLASGCRALAA